MMNIQPVSWKSFRPGIVSLSSSEAEFGAASQAGQEVFYLCETLKDFGYQQNTATDINEDNLACAAKGSVRSCFRESRRNWTCLGTKFRKHAQD